METIYRRAIRNGIQSSKSPLLQINSKASRCTRSIHTSPHLAANAPKKAPLKSQRIEKPYRPPTRPPPGLPSSPPPPPPRPNPLKNRTIPIVLGSITLLGLSSYLSYLYILFSRKNSSDEAPGISAAAQPDISSRYNAIASSFDDEVEWTEKLMGIKKMRKQLAAMAKGDVLEVSIGTGRNLEGYKGFDTRKYEGEELKSFTAVDMSEEMLEVAHEKFSRLYPGIVGVRWVNADASKPGAIPGPPRNANERSGTKEGGFDTVVQTMGLCSVDDPVALLKNLGNVVKEETGRILLLEHGRGRWNWLNNLLDKFAEGHAKEYGCWWNRDLDAVVRESGLEIVEAQKWHGGTTQWFVLKKPKQEKTPEQLNAEKEARKVRR